MANLYYGGGNCSIDGSGIRGVQITYEGKVKIHDKTPDGFYIVTGKNKIVIFPLVRGHLSNLFEYEGSFKILRVIASDNNGQKISTIVKKVMDYSELLGDSESITTNSEDLKEGYVSKKKVNKTRVVGKNIIENQNTSKFETLYLPDGSVYEGNVHIHFDGSIMVGATHSKDAEELYFKREQTLVSNRVFTRQKPKKPKKRIRTTTTGGGY